MTNFRDKSLLNDPDHWRKGAADMRALAKTAVGHQQESLLKIAAEYDKLAERAASRLTGGPKSGDKPGGQ